MHLLMNFLPVLVKQYYFSLLTLIFQMLHGLNRYFQKYSHYSLTQHTLHRESCLTILTLLRQLISSLINLIRHLRTCPIEVIPFLIFSFLRLVHNHLLIYVDTLALS